MMPCFDPDEKERLADAPDLTGRKAKCRNCGMLTASDGSELKSFVYVPFLRIHEDEPYDEFYCGCRGWD